MQGPLSAVDLHPTPLRRLLSSVESSPSQRRESGQARKARRPGRGRGPYLSTRGAPRCPRVLFPPCSPLSPPPGSFPFVPLFRHGRGPFLKLRRRCSSSSVQLLHSPSCSAS